MINKRKKMSNKLLTAVKANNFELVNQILKPKHTFPKGSHLKVSPDFVDVETGKTILETAIDLGSFEMSDALMSYGATIKDEYMERFLALKDNTCSIARDIVNLDPEQLQALDNTYNQKVKALIDSNKKYKLGELTDGLYTVKDAVTNTEVLKPSKADGEISYKISNPYQNPGLLKSVYDSKPGVWDIKSCSNIEQVKLLVLEFGGLQNLRFNEDDISIKMIKSQIQAQFPGAIFRGKEPEPVILEDNKTGVRFKQ